MSNVCAIRSSGIVVVLFEMANCTCVVVSRISSGGRFLIVQSMCLLILFALYGVMFVNYLLNAFALSISVMGVLVLIQMLLFCCVGCFLLDNFAMVPTESVDCICHQFYPDLFPSVYFVFVYLFVYVIAKSNDLWI